MVPLQVVKSPLAKQLAASLGPSTVVNDRPLLALTHISKDGDPPGMLVLNAVETAVDQAIALLPQIYSGTTLQDARVVLRVADATPEQLANAYDLGAHEAVCATMPAGQLATRIRRQLRLHAQELLRKSGVRAQLKLAIIDPLTGLHNRRYAMEYLAKLMTDAQDQRSSFALLALDVDHFKSINDRYGHSVGDQVLKAIGTCLKSNMRADDLVARSGGEEFLIALRDTKHEVAKAAAERLRHRISALLVDVKAHVQPLSVTLSIGLAMQNGEAQLDSILDRADQALYAAKAQGRNTVSLCSDAA